MKSSHNYTSVLYLSQVLGRVVQELLVHLASKLIRRILSQWLYRPGRYFCSLL